MSSGTGSTVSTYRQELPKVFPSTLPMETKEEAAEIVSWLLDAGTSFAVTMDRPYSLWLSAASLDVIARRTGL